MSDTDQEINERVARASGLPERKAGAVHYGCHPVRFPVQNANGSWRAYSPTTDWRDCGPLLEGLAAAQAGVDIWTNQAEEIRVRWNSGQGVADTMPRAICIAWLAWKENES